MAVLDSPNISAISSNNLIRGIIYYIMAFNTTTDAIQAETYAKNRISSTIMPVPREISSGCGLALRFMETDEQSILTFCKDAPLNGSLYRMETRRVNGRHPIKKILPTE